MTRLFAALLASLALVAPATRAQTFPSKPVHLVVPFPAGGTADLLARSMADVLAESWRQPVVVENKPGAGSLLATQYVQRAPPDGATLLMVAPSFVVNPMVSAEAHYDALKDFVPVTLLVTSPLVVVVNAASPARTLKELIELARASPGKLSFASVGPNTTQQMIGEMLKLEEKIDWVYAPYAGGAPAVTALLGNHVAAVIGNYSEVSAHIGAGKLRAVAVGTRERLEALKDVPTLGELGYSLIDATIWFGIVAPAGTPAAAVERIRADMQRAVSLASVREKLVAQSLYPTTSGEPFGAFLSAQSQRYGALIRQARLKN
ncbi:MAG TPA: tripartite tricarboxylate transporter substrate binding protein [Usitatibacter sp.]|nr:tripartite tricarboxylate transporter substrate binding protein [Usitatibacter sp.]